jgi:hypothetical protein
MPGGVPLGACILGSMLVGKQASEASLLARGSNSSPELPPAYLSNFETVTISNVQLIQASQATGAAVEALLPGL